MLNGAHYRRYWVQLSDETAGFVTLYEGLIVEATSNVATLLGKEWHRVLQFLRNYHEVSL